ncbi:transmembrane protein [Heterostelium album PN500]|uniref:Transmembrane protein n=1 Tax=Heterostelium pallidum (strain ATCC 26659 / Pp 5 / PN500) TaxID=670386 RepID=D3BIG1_HETP5|nr:transmembrane protein [Heterostelium album PN500]EFA79061.1 transmembrane protein [Heterostelium album PN500]|eukprot:XP_020431184.1 transmembrane protein [Heterostelium album PN500]
MGNQGAKRRKQQNESEIFKLRVAILSVNVIYYLYRVYYHGDSFGGWNWFLWIVSLLLVGIAYFLISLMAKPTFQDGELIDGGADLSMKGLVEYYFDTIYICLIILILGLFSDKAFLIMLIIPVFAFYQLWVKFLGPWFFQQPSEDTNQMETKSKRREKMEKKANKIKYSR